MDSNSNSPVMSRHSPSLLPEGRKEQQVLLILRLVLLRGRLLRLRRLRFRFRLGLGLLLLPDLFTAISNPLHRPRAPGLELQPLVPLGEELLVLAGGGDDPRDPRLLGLLQTLLPRRDDLEGFEVVACENAIGATDTLAEHIKDPKNTPENRLADHDKRARYANSAIDRIVPAQDPDAGLDVTLEKFFEWVVERTPFADVGVPTIDGINWVDNLEPFIERKLYTVNTGHATAAYHGYNRQKRTVYDALQDRHIRSEVEKALQNTARLITDKHDIEHEHQKIGRAHV